MVAKLQQALREKANPEKAAFFPQFFKTGPGEYGEGDQFLGVTVPNVRLVAKQGRDLSFGELEVLLRSPWHEERLLALIIMVNQFKTSTPIRQKELFEFYLAHTSSINNWDLVDTSARDIVGAYIYANQELLLKLDELANSNSLWERRIAMIATFYFLTKGEPDVTVRIATKLLHDREDLMHKAVGWMLREMGKRCDHQVLVDFLKTHYKVMPRTMLRYAIEHFDEKTRQNYLKGGV
jgi:3-methyladenine DNA glycosylase AlkD